MSNEQLQRAVADRFATRASPPRKRGTTSGCIACGSAARAGATATGAAASTRTGLPARRRLERYAEVFDTVEVNTTFYRLPRRDAVADWVEQTPHGFVFAVKASRYLTHMRRLRDIADGVARFWEPLEPLATRAPAGAGPVAAAGELRARRRAPRRCARAAAARRATASSSATRAGSRRRRRAAAPGTAPRWRSPTTADARCPAVRTASRSPTCACTTATAAATATTADERARRAGGGGSACAARRRLRLPQQRLEGIRARQCPAAAPRALGGGRVT